MPVSKNQNTTSNIDPVAREQVLAQRPDQHTFHEHLRALTCDAVRVVIEQDTR